MGFPSDPRLTFLVFSAKRPLPQEYFYGDVELSGRLPECQMQPVAQRSPFGTRQQLAETPRESIRRDLEDRS
jgi:hypothetical protein